MVAANKYIIIKDRNKGKRANKDRNKKKDKKMRAKRPFAHLSDAELSAKIAAINRNKLVKQKTGKDIGIPHLDYLAKKIKTGANSFIKTEAF